MKKLNLREKQIELVAKFLLEENNLNDWNVSFRHMTRTLGKCFRFQKRLQFSTYFIANKPYDRMLNTVLHEIAHALTPANEPSHGSYWKQQAQKLGAIPKARLSDTSFQSEKEKI